MTDGYTYDHKGKKSMGRLLLFMNHVAGIYVVFIASLIILASAFGKANALGEGIGLVSIGGSLMVGGQFFKDRQTKNESAAV